MEEEIVSPHDCLVVERCERLKIDNRLKKQHMGGLVQERREVPTTLTTLKWGVIRGSSGPGSLKGTQFNS